MIIVAHRSSGDAPDSNRSTFLLVKTRHALQRSDGKGQVLCMSERVVYPERNVHSILARGSWKDYTGPQDVLPGLLAQVAHRLPASEDANRDRMIIIAHRSAGDEPDFNDSSFLLVKTRHALRQDRGQAQVLDMAEKILYPEFNVHSILARGYWESYTGPQNVLPGLLKQVERRPPLPTKGHS